MADPLPEFDPDLSPENFHNVEAAKARGLVFDRRRRVYRDRDGYPVRDEFGQTLG